MSRNPIDLFVEACHRCPEAIFRKGAAPWTITVDDKLTLFPAGTQLLTLLLVAEPSKAEAAIQFSMENALYWRPRWPERHRSHAIPAGACADCACGTGGGMRKSREFWRGHGQAAAHQGRKLESGQTNFTDRPQRRVQRASNFKCFSPRTGLKTMQRQRLRRPSQDRKASMFRCSRMWKSMSSSNSASDGFHCARLAN